MGFLAPAVAPMVAKNGCTLISYVPVFVDDSTLDTPTFSTPTSKKCTTENGNGMEKMAR